MNPTESISAAPDHSEESESLESTKDNEGIPSGADEELSDKEKLQLQKQLKPYDYKVNIKDNDKEEVKKIY
ncbi:hypothetical protein [Pseudomonas paracarnis]|uniref:hypothetical protein n=1 Tax=Pseudomonas paracarnis TaxID=2750625 RepID=UPI0029392C6B|nr:hypothetical protein [Pseudomonas paracarnis]MDV3057776.1 hypothetical protein [Pseudomonas paracarnis]